MLELPPLLVSREGRYRGGPPLTRSVLSQAPTSAPTRQVSGDPEVFEPPLQRTRLTPIEDRNPAPGRVQAM
eukprot:6517601-Pyramimonas_sp.AAC.1